MNGSLERPEFILVLMPYGCRVIHRAKAKMQSTPKIKDRNAFLLFVLNRPSRDDRPQTARAVHCPVSRIVANLK
jgi:hypothetical protein